MDLFGQLNIVIISDHGMTGTGPGSNITYVDLKDYMDINDVMKVLDFGAGAAIAPLPRNTEKVRVPNTSNIHRKHVLIFFKLISNFNPGVFGFEKNARS